jgi:uncharacterized membrane protein YtjA (UPF0391 family)
MLRWAATFFIISIVAGLLGFTSIAGTAYAIAKFLFFIFLVIAIVLFVLAKNTLT